MAGHTDHDHIPVYSVMHLGFVCTKCGRYLADLTMDRRNN